MKTLWLLFCLTGSWPAAAQAWESLSISGFESDSHRQGFAYSGAILQKPIRGKLSLSLLGMGSFLYYRYPVDSRAARVESPGVHYLAGGRYSWSKEIYLALWGGGVTRSNKILGGSPSQTRGDTGGAFQAELNFPILKRHSFNALAAYNEKDSYIWSRLTLKREFHNCFMGIVGTFQGNFQYKAQQGGLFLETWNLPGQISASLQGGYKWDSSWGKGGYGALNFSKQF